MSARVLENAACGALPQAGPTPAPPLHADGRPEIYLQPGRIHATAAPSTLRTILGSCVAICLYDPTLPAGGMNHYLLPYRFADSGEPTRFAAPALARLIAAMLDLGGRKSRLQAKVFGGACVLQSVTPAGNDLGSRNAAVAFELLAEERIPVIAHDVGGSRSRKLIYRTDDGAAFIRRL
jgi:chemotaxis protein CheD